MVRRLVTAAPSRAVWTAWVVVALLLLNWATGAAYLAWVAGSALLLATVPALRPRHAATGRRRDLVAVGVCYLGVVVLMRVAFVGFTQDRVTGLFLCFAAALLLGSIGPVVYTVWGSGGSLSDLGLRSDNLRSAAGYALLFAGVQFALTLWGYDLPAASAWVPLLCMALVVGVFESIFFRGFVQSRLEDHVGPVLGVGGAATLYGLYHVGYGMGGSEILFLTGLGVVYAVTFTLARNLLVLWPLLTPLGSFFANLEAGDIDLPWASIAGFADVLAAILVTLWLAQRHHRRATARGARSPA